MAGKHAAPKTVKTVAQDVKGALGISAGVRAVRRHRALNNRQDWSGQ